MVKHHTRGHRAFAHGMRDIKTLHAGNRIHSELFLQGFEALTDGHLVINLSRDRRQRVGIGEFQITTSRAGGIDMESDFAPCKFTDRGL
ncbi:Uncharacterised protein [Vibrio cholerae]|uniref:Uncharacterized protein n=1 Tax=Vibrio cholerae TaxID=666 RepID=A0A655UQP4_VIBCL|nr:Uncharacterised protein [Vibrio cholerae]